ncbi:UDP-N-acetylmuramate--L-alanine ligase [Candidatus Purcelliella pentastirinorum]|uniref:UDP-N-acetylmuramate--L-alanine ligase n=1 Tax=Candidatus Purcelliella pentastirinorum TaxID=472834 RepID=UPI00237B9869|nr:UDP-N-acetylmuramate--L-alanine ligase [Candidatus Purcelliella pentastirinorum]WDR80318.1 UDP-N-acetylmuramate--L-alanine ligase [Candidatus Purcelliella pentastirinorum]
MNFLTYFKNNFSVFSSINIPKSMYFIGIGGSGMVGLAKILLDMGFFVSGSDIEINSNVDYLLSLGVLVYHTHDSNNIKNVDVVIYSSAIENDNVEVLSALELNIPVISRAEMLSELIRFSYGIAVAGTHGKTTTSALVFDIYFNNDRNPSIVNGGYIKSIGSYSFLGSSNCFIFEADESDSSFLCFHPMVIIITNIEPEHLSNYDGSFKKLQNAFIKFLHNLPFYGKAILCIDDLVIRDLIPNICCKFITYGFSHDADVHIYNYKQIGLKSSFRILYKDKYDIKILLNMPGKHNALNATAALTIAKEDNIDDKHILKALKKYKGTKRRFEYIGEFSLSIINGRIGNFIIVDDYGHHPTEIYMSILTARKCWTNRRIIMVFQPNRFTRTRDLYSEFINILSNVDVLFISNIYSSNELPILGINSTKLCSDIFILGKLSPIFVKDFDCLVDKLKVILTCNDVLIIQGAGDITNVIKKLLKII